MGWDTRATGWSSSDAPIEADLPPTLEPARLLPRAVGVLAAATIPIVAVTAGSEVGVGFAFRDVVALLTAYAVASALLLRVPWSKLGEASLLILFGYQILFVASLTTITGGGASPYFALYAPILGLAGWHLRPLSVGAVVGQVALTETWRAVAVDGHGSVDQVTVALPFFAAVAFLAMATARRLSSAVVTIRRDQILTADVLAAVRGITADPAVDPLTGMARLAGRLFDAEARLVQFEPPTSTTSDLLGTTPDGRSLSCAVSGASSTYAILGLERRRPFSTTEARLAGILAGSFGRAIDANRLFRELVTASERDGLTGLLNRRTFEQDLAGHLGPALAAGRTAAVCFVDIDGMKAVNDRHGHEQGDRLIRQAGRSLVAASRDDDRVYRVGGDEFVVVALDISEAGAEALAERLRASQGAARQRSADASAAAPVTLSVGLAYARDGATSCPAAEALLAAADRAMYATKAAGGDAVTRA